MNSVRTAPLNIGNLNHAAQTRQEIRRPKAEARRPKEDRRPKTESRKKAEDRKPSQTTPPLVLPRRNRKITVATVHSKTWRNFQELRVICPFGPRPSDFFRVSALGL